MRMRVIKGDNNRVSLTWDDILESVVSGVTGQPCYLTGWLGSPFERLQRNNKLVLKIMSVHGSNVTCHSRKCKTHLMGMANLKLNLQFGVSVLMH